MNVDKINLEVSKVEKEISKYLNKKIALLEENIGLHINPKIIDRRGYACDYYSFEMNLVIEFIKPSKYTRKYLFNQRKMIK